MRLGTANIPMVIAKDRREIIGIPKISKLVNQEGNFSVMALMLVFNREICLKLSGEFNSVYLYRIGKIKN